ncbi:MAG: phosphatidate cytidylyltransferase [Opitutae bacterium]|nr:phosphatidate cytidylyltransferase [Opitutae bacterium]MBT5381187.1 phosphatidate cytidylyltransferase [Opitutae bacterium]MBT5689804.1 phosphatidate cytidylyltransferase [Opitutae bacterium]MBT6462546.1 phosphatidate cytidylyltransferase [Opitutae bacterium]MBT6957486.1 phosphatidate cytidylyltransferase [Opitutae bacterium]
MKKRILSTFALWGGLFAVVYLLKIHGGILILTVLSAGAQWELYQIWQKAGRRVAPAAGVFAGILLIPSAYYLRVLDATDHLFKDDWASIGILGVATVLVAWLMMRIFPPKTRFPGEAMIPTALGVLYVPFLLQYLLQLYLLERGAGGLFLCVWVIITVKFTDMGALLVGKFFGKNKMAPTLSPKKTWEGAIGGSLFSVLGSILAAQIGNQYLELGFEFNLGLAALLAIPICITGQLGDLVESGFKRQAGVKDSGHSIPGIGGALDLMDSLIFTAPLAYLLIKIFGTGHS